jgi:hypothetical protein
MTQIGRHTRSIGNIITGQFGNIRRQFQQHREGLSDAAAGPEHRHFRRRHETRRKRGRRRRAERSDRLTTQCSTTNSREHSIFVVAVAAAAAFVLVDSIALNRTIESENAVNHLPELMRLSKKGFGDSGRYDDDAARMMRWIFLRLYSGVHRQCVGRRR